jgi:hypothetical protein
MVDELNKYAPREGSSPIKEVLLDIAAHRTGVKDLRPLRGHSAVGLRPILDTSPRCGAP